MSATSPEKSSQAKTPGRSKSRSPSPRQVVWEAVGMTDVGLRRTSNQDHILVDARSGIFILADGMGGHRAGERASRMAAWYIFRFLREELHKEPTATRTPAEPRERWQHALRLAINGANRHIFEYAASYPQFRGMGTTVVVTVLVDDYALVAHAGDSRLYRLGTEGLRRVTRDHSRLQDLIDLYQLSEEAARNHPFRNVITRSLGNHPEVEVDLLDFQLDASEVLLLCTDGLCGVLSDAEIQEIVDSAQGQLERACRRLLQAVTQAGAPDNVSVIMLRKSPQPQPAVL